MKTQDLGPGLIRAGKNGVLHINLREILKRMLMDCDTHQVEVRRFSDPNSIGKRVEDIYRFVYERTSLGKRVTLSDLSRYPLRSVPHNAREAVYDALKIDGRVSIRLHKPKRGPSTKCFFLTAQAPIVAPTN